MHRARSRDTQKPFIETKVYQFSQANLGSKYTFCLAIYIANPRKSRNLMKILNLLGHFD